MTKLIVLKLIGDFEQGFHAHLAIAIEGQYPTTEVTGTLPPALHLKTQYQRWRSLYQRSVFMDRAIAPQRITYDGSPAARQRDCQAAADDLTTGFNAWLAADSFRQIERHCLELLTPSEEVRVVIQSACRDVLRLPWHLWQFIDCYHNVEVALRSAQTTLTVPQPCTQPRDGVKILSIFGNSQGIEISRDRQLLEQLNSTELTTLVEPQRRDINDYLWEQPWDILFFAGHGQTQAEEGRIHINGQEYLTLKELKYGLKKAIARGLQIAIFNACDGLGLAWDLEDLPIPHLIVMREPVPDRVAQAFLDYFLQGYAEGQSFPQAVREARQRLQGLEKDYVCASWLPVTFRHPAIAPPTWQSLGGKQRQPRPSLVTLVIARLANTTALKRQISDTDPHTRNQRYLDNILLPHRRRVEGHLSRYGGQVVQTDGDVFCLTFTQPDAALQWALMLQQSHAHDPITPPTAHVQIGIQIGIHTGSPLYDGPNVVGHEVDYTARLARLAHGGQVLVSEVTVALVRSHPGHGFRFHRHGDRRLEDIGTVPIFEALAPQQAPHPLRGDRPHAPLQIAGVVSLVATMVVVGLRGLGGVQGLELQAFDTLLRSRPAESLDSRILVVTATETDLQRYGVPLPDGILAAAIAALQPHQPRLIGLNIFREQPRAPGQTQLQQQLQEDNVIAVCSVSEANNPNRPGLAPPPSVSPENLGFSDVILDFDRVLRRQLVFMQPSPQDVCQTEYSFSARLALRYLQQEGVEITPISRDRLQLGAAHLDRLTPSTGAYHNLDHRGFQLLLNYRAGAVAATVGLAEVLAGTVSPDLIRDRIVLIGITSPLSQSSVNLLTPYSAQTQPYTELPGVMINAHAISQLLAAALDGRSLIWVWPEVLELLWIAAWAMVGGGGVVRSRRLWVKGVVIGAAGVILSGLCWLVLLQGGWLPWLPAGLAIALSAGGSLASQKLMKPP